MCLERNGNKNSFVLLLKSGNVKGVKRFFIGDFWNSVVSVD